MKKTVYRDPIKELQEICKNSKFHIKLEDLEPDNWDEEIGEVLLRLNPSLNESHSTVKPLDEIQPGDIILVNNFKNNVTGNDVHNSEHKILVITSNIKNNVHKSTFDGYYLSSQVDKANKFNPKYPHDIYINDYSTILDDAANSAHRAVFLNARDICTVTPADLKENNWYMGRASKEFMNFLLNFQKKMYSGEDVSGIFWEK